MHLHLRSAAVAAASAALGVLVLASGARAQSPAAGSASGADRALIPAATVSGTVDAQGGLIERDYYSRYQPAPWPADGLLGYGTRVTVHCWVHGPSVTGPYGPTDAWDVLVVSEGHYVVASDAWIYTAGDVRQQLGNCDI